MSQIQSVVAWQRRAVVCSLLPLPPSLAEHESTAVHEGVQKASRGSNIVLGTDYLLAPLRGTAIRGTPRCCPPSPTRLRCPSCLFNRSLPA